MYKFAYPFTLAAKEFIDEDKDKLTMSILGPTSVFITSG